MSNPRAATRIFRLFCAAMLLAAAACQVNQRSEVATYRKLIDANHPADAPITPGGVVTLTDALRIANQNTENLSIQGETYLQSLINKDRVFSQFLPTISLAPSYSLSQSTTNTFGGPVSRNLTVPISLEESVNPYSTYNSLKAADATIEQQKQLVLDLQQTVLLDVIQAYYQVLTSEQSVVVLENSLKVQQTRVDNIQEQRKIGTARPLDVAQAEAQASATQVSLNQSRADVRNARATLAFLLDAQVEENPLRDDYDPPDQIPALTEWLDSAEAGRQDLLAAAAAVKAARRNVEVAVGGFYPSVNLGLDYELYSDAIPGVGAWTGLAQLTQPLYTGGLVHANIRTAWSQFRQAALTQAQLRRQIDETTEQAYTNLDLARKQLRELQIEVKAARDALYLADQLYKNGTDILLDVLTAQDTLLTTQLQLSTEVFTQKTAYFNLLRLIGKLTTTIYGATTRPADRSLINLTTQPVTAPSTRPH